MGRIKKPEPKHETFFLDDLLSHDPTKICPECESSQIVQQRTHNMDGMDYRCGDCGMTYEIVLYNRADADPH